jgi:hypothetical protein
MEVTRSTYLADEVKSEETHLRGAASNNQRDLLYKNSPSMSSMSSMSNPNKPKPYYYRSAPVKRPVWNY